MQMRSI
jgi:hypothetical protein